jgi:hypothetical protein
MILTKVAILLTGVLLFHQGQSQTKKHSLIHPYPENRHYMAWANTPVFPLGATSYHSWTPISRPVEVDFIGQLDRLAEVINDIGSPHVCGFVRCLPYDPMNHLHDGKVERVLQPWIKLDSGQYDLEKFNPEWEERLRAYLSATLKRRFIVSLEVWDDWSVTRGPAGAYDPGEGYGWNAHPFNPKNNVNYNESQFSVSTSPCNSPFYNTIPSKSNNPEVLTLQQKYVDKLLSIAIDYPNIIINISNESRAHVEWSRYWVAYIRERLPEGFMIGEMPSTNRKDGGGECDPELNPLNLCTDVNYDFVDIAQGVSAHEFGEPRQQALGGAQRIQTYRQAMNEAGTIRPLVVSKDYTRDIKGGDMVLWSRFIGGAAAARFHRPAGDSPETVSQFQHEAIDRLGKFIATVPFWEMHPDPDIVVSLPEGTGANVFADPEKICVIQLIGASGGGILRLKLSPGAWSVSELDPGTGTTLNVSKITSDSPTFPVPFNAGADHRVLLLKKINNN